LEAHLNGVSSHGHKGSHCCTADIKDVYLFYSEDLSVQVHSSSLNLLEMMLECNLKPDVLTPVATISLKHTKEFMV